MPLQRFYGEQITAEALTIPVRPLHSADRLIWSATADGQYSVKSNYFTLLQSFSTQPNDGASTSQ